MSCNSFKRELDSSQAVYRCLDSPKAAVEPLSPPHLSFAWSDTAQSRNLDSSIESKVNNRYCSSTGGERRTILRNDLQSTEFIETARELSDQSSNTKIISRNSQSPMNVLALIAVAASPKYSFKQFPSDLSTGLRDDSAEAACYSNECDKRPSKRARSENLYPSRLHSQRFRTSSSRLIFGNYGAPSQLGNPGKIIQQEITTDVHSGEKILEAELLLSFAKGEISSIDGPADDIAQFSNRTSHIEPGLSGDGEPRERSTRVNSLLKQTFTNKPNWNNRQFNQVEYINHSPQRLDTFSRKYEENDNDFSLMNRESHVDHSINKSILATGPAFKQSTPKAKGAHRHGLVVREGSEYVNEDVIDKVKAEKLQASAVETSKSRYVSQSSSASNLSAKVNFDRKEYTLEILRRSFDDEVSRFERASSMPSVKANHFSYSFKRRAQSIPTEMLPGPIIAREGRSRSRRSSKRASKRIKAVNFCESCNLSAKSMSEDCESWIRCNGCKKWFHIICAGFRHERQVRSIDKYHCPGCQDVHGSSTCKLRPSAAFQI